MWGGFFEEKLTLWVVGRKKCRSPQLGLVQNSQKTVECDLKRKRNNHIFVETGNPLNETFANNEDQDKRLYNAVFHQGLHCLLREKRLKKK